MDAKEFRELHKKPDASIKTNMTAEEWRDHMRLKKNSPSTKYVDEIRIMLKLAKIDFREEFVFHPTRKWRFDFALPEHLIALEYEGIFGSGVTAHTSITGYLDDVEKYNEATLLGWRVLRYTAKNYKNVVNDLWNLQFKK